MKNTKASKALMSIFLTEKEDVLINFRRCSRS